MTIEDEFEVPSKFGKNVPNFDFLQFPRSKT